MSKKIALILISSLMFLNSLIMPFAVAHAADEAPSTWYNQSFSSWYSKVYDQTNSPPSEIFGERYTAAQVQWIIWSLLAFPITIDTESAQAISCSLSIMTSDGAIDVAGCGKAIFDRLNQVKEYLEKIDFVSEADSQKTPLALVFSYQNRPISGIRYLSNIVSKFHVVPTANAQGFGYTSLDPIQKYWSGVRNVAYALTVLVVIIFAFMIMFRVKLSPQLVISVQSTLPKVIGALVLATFSYAIAGFVIDLMYVFGGLMAALINLAGFTKGGNDFKSIYNSIFPSNITGLYFFIKLIIYDVVFLIGLIISLVAMLSTGTFGFQGQILSTLSLLLIIWVFLLSLWYTLKANWVLIKTLISFYINVITGPLQIILGPLVPSFGFGPWLTKLFADILVFPVTGVLMFFAYRLLWTSMFFNLHVLLEQNLAMQIAEATGILDWIGSFSMFDWVGDGNVIWVPSIMGFGESMSGLIIMFMSLGVVIAIPKVPDILKMILMKGKFEYGSAVGEAMSAFGVLPMAQKVGGEFVQNKLYNPRDGKGAIPTLWSKYGPNKAKGGTPQVSGPVNTP